MGSSLVFGTEPQFEHLDSVPEREKMQLFSFSPLFHLTLYLSSFMALLALMRTLTGLFLPTSLWKQHSESLAVSQTRLTQSLLPLLLVHPKVTGHPKLIHFNGFVMSEFNYISLGEVCVCQSVQKGLLAIHFLHWNRFDIFVSVPSSGPSLPCKTPNIRIWEGQRVRLR